MQYDLPSIVIVPSQWVMPLKIISDSCELKSLSKMQMFLLNILKIEKQNKLQTKKERKKQMKPLSGDCAKTSLFRSFMFQRSRSEGQGHCHECQSEHGSSTQRTIFCPVGPICLIPKGGRPDFCERQRGQKVPAAAPHHHSVPPAR